MRSKSTDFSRWWGVGAKAPHNLYSTNEVGGMRSQETVTLEQRLFPNRHFREATDEVGGHSLIGKGKHSKPWQFFLCHQFLLQVDFSTLAFGSTEH